MKKLVLIFTLTMIGCTAFAQLEKPVTWAYFAKRINKTEAILCMKATMQGNWHMYSQSIKSVPMQAKFSFSPSKDYTLIGKTIEPKPISKYDKNLKLDLTYFEKQVVFQQRIKLAKTSTVVKTKVEFVVCNDKSCLPADEVTFSIPVR